MACAMTRAPRSKEQDQEATECHPSSRSPVSSCPAFQSNALPLDLNTSARSPCPSDEGYPSAPCSPSSDYIESKGSEEGKCIKVDLLHFLDSIEELGKMDLFYRIVRLAHWELDGELIIRDRLDHQQKLQRVNKEVKLAYLVKLQEEGLDFDDEDITGVLDEMGNIDIPCKLYKSNKSSESQEFSDAGVDMTAPSDLDETPASDSLAPSPLEPPPLPPKPPTRHVSAHSESHSYENISGHVFSVSSTNDATNVSTRVPTMPALSSSPPALKPPALPPPPSQPVPYFTLNTDRPALTSPTPPIPPPRRRHKARLEAQRLAELEREKTPLSLPPPVSRPPPLPPPPAMSSPPAVPSPPSLPQPPSFHTLDVEIRKLLALAGLTQAELLKLSPELGVCVDVVLDNEQQPMSDDSQIGEISVNRTHKEEGVDKGLHSRLKEGSIFGKDRSTAVRSFSFAGSEQKNAAWMGEDVRPSLSAEGLSSACLQEKKILVNSVSVAVEAILAQFSSSRTVVQKTLSGDSSVNPCLGRLVLQCLCPALRSLLSDGLKPHQSDLIAGRRPNSPWGLVQASTKPGPSTQALHNLQTKVAGLPQLKQSRHKFNAFLFGLLNVKLLDYWLSHLQSSSDVLETYYRPTSFMRLSLTSCQPLFEELLLLLQPLSLLTFNLDLLFQHHHLDPSSPTLTPASHTSEIYSPPNEDFSFHLSPKGLFQGSSHHLGSVLQQDQGSLSLDLQSGLTSHILDLSAYRNPISLSSGDTKEEASLTLSWFKGSESSMPLNAGSLSQQAGQALQQGWGAVMRFGERLGQNFGLATSTEVDKSPNSPGDFKTGFSLNPKSPDEKRQQPRDDLSLKDNGAAVPWGLGRLFGASKSPNNPPASRRPSQWLSPGASVLSRIVNLGQGSPPEKREPQRSKDKEEDEKEEINETGDQPKPLMMVRTLCDHTGAGAELSFRKGEELVLLGGVNHDWIRCRQGHKEGLVPIGYASLIM
ncbi:hypothetical protein cypCar_00030004 [Cyprinus carpio]|nr:hypothetical protein cypCar_00030004 [Cyprinus carpio]